MVTIKNQLNLIICFLVTNSSLGARTNQQNINFLQKFISSGSLVFDVGANVGDKTVQYLTCGAKVICFDPQPACIASLKKRFNKNPFVHIEPVGLADQEGELQMYLCTSSNTISTLSQNWVNFSRFHDFGYKWDQTIKVPVKTLDQMIKKYGLPDFCKIDVEGFEYQVISGLTHKIPTISFEFAAETLNNIKKCIERLTSLGYTKFNFGKGDHSSFLFPCWISAEEVINSLENMVKTDSLVWGDIYAS